MNAILGITEIQLENKANSHGTIEALDTIYSSGNLLMGIINDLLDLSKIESGKMELSPTNYQFASIINDVVQLNILNLESKPIEFIVHVDEALPASLYGDELRIKQVLNNLLSNAFKYTKKGEIEFSATNEPAEQSDPEHEVMLVFSVRDTGQGMTEDQINNLFDEYSRFDTDANRRTEGTGLGMSIAQHLIHMMKGEIHVDSEPGKGTQFIVRLPQQLAGSDIIGKEVADNLKHFYMAGQQKRKNVQIMREYMPYGRVLIVDDVQTNLSVAKGLLMPYGLQIETAESGFEAIEKITGGSLYDIIFMDHMMPGMDGIEAAKKMRDFGYALPIVALTANAMLGQVKMFLANGFDDFIPKPIDIRQLNFLLNRMIRDKQPPEVIESARRKEPSHRPNAPVSAQQVGLLLAETAANDAEKACIALEAVIKKQGKYSESDLQTFIICAHAMKGVMASIGEPELSEAARRLEDAGKRRDLGALSLDTPAFLNEMRALIKKIKSEPPSADGALCGDWAHLRENLHKIKAACEIYDVNEASHVLNELLQKPWPRQTRDALNFINTHLLHSDFDAAAAGAVDCVDTIKE
jgi:CheY-like chemotaxis protein/two-component sensor histidine kinase